MKPSRTHRFGGQTYLPCTWTDSTQAGYRWYRLTRHECGLLYSEIHSKRFRTLEECRHDAVEQDRVEYLLENVTN